MPSSRQVDSLSSGMGSLKVGSSKPARPGNVASMFDKRQLNAKESQPSIPEDGFTTVSHAKTRTVEKPTMRNYGNRQSPPSAAAQSRRAAYDPPTKASSHYKQSCLPSDQRDPLLAEIEANRGKDFHKSQFKPGMIIRGMLHEQDYKATSTGSNITIIDKDARYRSETKFGAVFTKYRKMIVLALFEDHYLAIPLFTHNGNGLAYKANPDEFVSIHDHRRPGASVKQSNHAPLRTEVLNEGIQFFDVKSTAHVTYALSRRYDLPIVFEGFLSKPSTNRLVDLFMKYAPKYLKDREGKIY